MSTIGPKLLAWVLDQHGPALELFARQWCSSPSDVVQDALVELARLHVVPENLVGWLYRVVRNRAIDASRREQRRARHETAFAEQATSWLLPAGETQLDAAAAGECLARLALQEREIVVLHLWSGLSFEEIAPLVGVSSSTAHRHYRAALESMRRMLEEPCQPNTKNRPK